ncbi:MAG: rhomboid family intramembrane serine protease [Bacteroidales bacterium]|nr:rhomboid family intramembrane serine protease [Bacteroidales bacterium]
MAQYQPQGFSLLPAAVKHLLIINAICYAAYRLLLMQHILDLNYLLGLWHPATGGFRPWQPLTYMFMHANVSHLFFNMFALWMFGNTMENLWGTKRFLIYYLACGLGAGLLSLCIPGATLTVGASGAVYGLLLAFGMTFPNEYIYLYFLMPIKAKWFVIGYAAIELIQGVFYSYDGVAHFAHLGGMLVGLLLILWWRRRPFLKI